METVSVEVNFDQCFMENWCYDHDDCDVSIVGINITSLDNAAIITNHNATTLGGCAIEVHAISSAVTALSLFNCTLKGRDGINGYTSSNGVEIYVGQAASKCMFLNMTQTHINSTLRGVTIKPANQLSNQNSCTLELLLSDNSIYSGNQISGLVQYGIVIYNNSNAVLHITNCRFVKILRAAIEFYNTSGIVSITGTTFKNNHDGLIVTRQAINVENSMYNFGNEMSDFYTRVYIDIKDSNFLQNLGGVIIDCYTKTNITIKLRDTVFRQNIGVSLGVKQLLTESTKLCDLTLYKVTFENNSVLLNTGIVQVDARINLSINDSCKFKKNRGSPIQALSTTVTLSGRISFEDNVAFQGGAISLGRSMLRLLSINGTNTSIVLSNNTVTNTGGGIYVESSPKTDDFTGSNRFYEIQGVMFHELSDNKVTLTFNNNSATNGGADIYGATPNSKCQIAYINERVVTSDEIQKYVFQANFKELMISSDPKRVCLFNSFQQLKCFNLSYIFYHTTSYPGEVFPISLAVVGLDFGMVTGPVYANLLGNSLSSLGNGEHVMQKGFAQNRIYPLTFRVNSNNSNEVIGLSTNGLAGSEVTSRELFSSLDSYVNGHPILIALLTLPVYINVKLLDCPPGFQLDKNGTCECSEQLKNIGIEDCMIQDNTPYIYRYSNQWIQAISTSSIITSKYCPFNYCNQNVTQLNLNDPDKQCALNHTGILCGACPSSLSLAIGSSRCKECPNDYNILLLIAFAAAGVLLVLFINVLNVTVAMGTINGLIFYSNIIWANQSVLFPSQTSHLLQFLKAFIAWLNLDLGIETCFIQGLDGHGKTWLQFVFPAYIWLIAGLIILASPALLNKSHKNTGRQFSICSSNTLPSLPC